MKISYSKEGWTPVRETQEKRPSIEKFREALEQDAKEATARGSGLPKDWRTRRLTLA